MTAVAFLAGPSALVAAVATVVGAITLGLFFSRGEPWGTRNDVASIVLMVATIPVTVAVAALQSRAFPVNVLAATVGVTGMVGASVAQGLLVARRRTYQQLLPWTLGFGAIVGAWYVLVGLLGLPTSDGPNISILAIAAGLGYVAIGYGFWRGNERHPLSIIGGLALLVASTWFLAWLGLKIVSGEIGFGGVS
jgi:hypothetical protein